MIFFFKIIITTIFLHIYLLAHCQIPCGVYNDALRILQIKEDLKTIDKSMKSIIELSDKSDPKSFNQNNRWITTKEVHAQNIQDIVSEYFLTQRIKQSSKNYKNELITLHQLLVSVMKCKQNVNKEFVKKSNELVDSFSELYFDDHGLKHLKNLQELQ